MYLATCTRPGLAYSLGQLSRFVSKPSSKHVRALKRVLRYLVGTTNYGIRYTRKISEATMDLTLPGYCDSDWGSDPEPRKSTSGFVFTLAGGAVAWMSRRQPIIALSTAEAEYVAACEASMEAVAECNILSEVLPSHKIKPKIGIDSSSAHIMASSPTYSRRTRHIELRWHYVREQVQRGALGLINVLGEENPADAFTKPLEKSRLAKLSEMMGITVVRHD
ncbi:Copia type Polyprotein [Phytophthora megakarya]|uniref:Copia type Polyprotein n=1 Tax=Phytophthora megakarya TaxID=4795 RepID=A0A225WMF1_9STRA|nr:Copia type Polyprotein [Phytophthora megakarya]